MPLGCGLIAIGLCWSGRPTRFDGGLLGKAAKKEEKAGFGLNCGGT
jgi:hypothetical protein